MRTGRYLVAAALAAVLAAPGVWAAQSAAVFGGVGIEERLGSYVPLDAPFTNDDGSTVTLGHLIQRPTVLALVYYRCPNACDYLLTGLASVLQDLPATPGKDYQVITMTIDPTETIKDALKGKRIGIESVENDFPPDAWRFLTGGQASITAVANAVGFHYVKEGDDFEHPLGLVILSPHGKIVRYMLGTDYLPVDLKMSILEASTGTVGPTIAKVLRFCFSYDPQGKTIVFNALKVTGSVTLLVAAGLATYLVIAGRRRRSIRGRA